MLTIMFYRHAISEWFKWR